MTKEQRATITKDEAKRIATIMASVIPNSRVRVNAYNITVIARSGKHIACWTGSPKRGWERAGY